MTEKLYTRDQVKKAIDDTLGIAYRPLEHLDEMGEGHEARTLRYDRKRLAKELGRAGARIYELRCQLEEARSLTTVSRTGYRSLLAERNDLVAQVARLEEKLRQAQTDIDVEDPKP